MVSHAVSGIFTSRNLCSKPSSFESLDNLSIKFDAISCVLVEVSISGNIIGAISLYNWAALCSVILNLKT